MRKFILFSSLFLFSSYTAFAGVLMADKEQIRENIESIEQSLDRGEIVGVLSLISPNASMDLKNEIEDKLGDKKIHFHEDDISQWIMTSPSSIKIKGSYSASADGWKMNGLGNYFVFEKVNGHWLIRDTNFHRKLNPEFLWNFMKKIMSIIFPLFILIFAFWIWMLVDCLNRQKEDKLVWVLVLVFLNILGAILYFFIGRKKVPNL